MTALTIPETDRPLLRRALDGGIRVIGRISQYEWQVSSRRPGKTHKVLVRDGKSACTCELSALGRKDCPHQAYARAFVAHLEGQQG